MVRNMWGQVAVVLLVFLVVAVLSVADSRADDAVVLGYGRAAIAGLLAAVVLQRIARLARSTPPVTASRSLRVLALVELGYVVVSVTSLVGDLGVVDGPLPVLLGLFLLAVHGTLAGGLAGRATEDSPTAQP